MNKNIMNQQFSEQVKLVEEKKCPVCKTSVSIDSFTDAVSLDEYEISGMCQKCQDKFFN
jgi:hypothetical protein